MRAAGSFCTVKLYHYWTRTAGVWRGYLRARKFSRRSMWPYGFVHFRLDEETMPRAEIETGARLAQSDIR